MRIFLAGFVWAACFAAEAQTIRVAGSVIDSESGRPLGRTRVTLRSAAGREWEAVTVGDGRFGFDVPAGKYSMAAAHRDWGDVYGEPLPGSESGAAVIAGPDCDTSRLVFRFRAPVAVYGKIVDESGEPVPSASVEVFHQTVVGGRKRVNSLGRAESNDFGEYSFSSLPAGSYFMAATGEPWYVSDIVAREQGIAQVPYGLVYYPGTPDAGRASAVVLRPGTEFRADFVLRPAAGTNLILKCEGCGGGSFTLHGMGPGKAETLIRPREIDCQASIPAVPAGRYMLRYKGSEGAARMALDVGGGDIPIEVRLKAAPTLEGKISFRKAAERPRHALFVNFVNEDSGEPQSVAVGADDSFSWPAVSTGHVRIYLSGSDGYFVAGMRVDGAVVKNGVIDVVDGESVRVEVLASRETGRFEGVVEEAAVLVVLAQDGGVFDPYRSFATLSATDGSFVFEHVPAGEYVLFTVKDREFAYADAEAMAAHAAGGKRVRIAVEGK